MNKTFVMLIVFSFLTGCAAETTPVSPQVTVIVITATPMPTATPFPTLDPITQATIAAEYAIPTPTTRPGFPTPVLSEDLFSRSQRGIGFYELYIGKYVIRRWGPSQYVSSSPYFNYTISTVGQPDIQTPVGSELPENKGGLNPLTGTDITGEGNPDVIIQIYSGGNHCCHSVELYDLGETAEKVFALSTADCPGTFLDLDGDGIYEYETCDPTFAYIKFSLSGLACSFAYSPFPKAIFQYSPEQGYTAANLRFADRYEEDITRHQEFIQEYLQDPSTAVAYPFSICDVSRLVLDYLYSGQSEEAWGILAQLYPAEEADHYRKIIEAELEDNPFFDAP